MRGESYLVVHFFENLPGFPFGELIPQDDLEGWEKNRSFGVSHANKLANLWMKVDFKKGENNR